MKIVKKSLFNGEKLMNVLEMAIEEVQDSPEDNPNVEITENGHYIVQ